MIMLWLMYIYVLICIFVIIYYRLNTIIRKYKETTKIKKRKKLLIQARNYLQPFDNIWKYQNLSNRFVNAQLIVHVINITSGDRKLDIKGKNQNDLDKVWDLILYNFNNNINYEELTNIIKSSKIDIILNEKSVKPLKTKTKAKTKQERLNEYFNMRETAIDVNNCSEFELTQLAGINIVFAKKIVIHREAVKGFKTKDEFIKFVNLKLHFQKQIANNIIIKKVKIIKPIKLTKERIIDI